MNLFVWNVRGAGKSVCFLLNESPYIMAILAPRIKLVRVENVIEALLFTSVCRINFVDLSVGVWLPWD